MAARSLDREVRSLIRDVPDFPKKGILFKDITPVLLNPRAFRRIVTAMAAYARRRKARVLAGIESRGFILGAALAERTGLGFIPIRKKGKLPWKTVRQEYALEYGRDAVEVHRDAAKKGARVLVVDDLLATGGTLAASCRLVERLGGVVAGCACVVELSFLNGRRKLRGRDLYSIVTY